jgi:hypothetical protein
VKHASFLLVSLALAAGCVGRISDDDNAVPDGPRNLCESGATDIAGPRLVRRLTATEYTASVRAVFGLADADWSGPALPADAAGRNGFTNNVDRLVIDDAYAQALYKSAEGVASVVVAPVRLARILPCAVQGNEACARTYLDTVGRRLFRRPLTDDERQRYLALHTKVRAANDDFATWVRWATVALLSSPSFVYRSELGEPDGDGYKLTGYEIATALAYGLTGAPPTEALLDRAASGELDTPPGIAAAARELAIDPATGKARLELRREFGTFTDQWLGLSVLGNLTKSTETVPGFDGGIRTAMRRETDSFIDKIVFEDHGGVRELLTSPVSVVEPSLATYYGWAGASGTVMRPAGWGVGLLAQGSLLAINAGNAYTSPTQRGALVRERLLCTDIPPPPPVVGDIPPPTGAETTRQRYEMHAENPSCSGCHQLMDPIGFAFEHLDAGGRYRAMEGPFPIDDRGVITDLGNDITFTGPDELASALAAAPQTSTCMASYMASHTYGLDHHDTSCLVSSLAQQLASGQIGIVDFYVGLTATRHFTNRVD